MNKNELRKFYKIVRKNIQNKEEQNSIILNKVIANKKVLDSSTLLIYVSFNDEVDTINIIKYFLGKKKIAVPKIEDNTMNFYYINSLNDLKPGYFNILEPATNLKVETFTNTTCIVPAICYDSNNYRIGYGKGFYDKFLANKNIYTIGISYKETLINKIPIDKYDINLNEVISPF